ncbi:putative lipoprotein [Leptospira fainei serovar Hurstbridge str. BUT 6]|uniref:Lipoprotein n=1 Tax=Leptospira fainei serovar Hurstbridge str. BUT 6 TaxID=1193011 RepID=S3UZK6_9LEPT|nr:hypothetical protein [Leptospira fainei]EPG74648.1 putative lipoprotein [Leptospira fainei serovar Hurstbridge str. BUT 6]
MRFNLLILGTIIALLVIGCNSTPLVIPADPAVKPLTKGQTISSYPISAESCGFQLLLFIPIGINSRHGEAYAKLTSLAAGSKISDLRMEESWYYAFVGTGYCTRFSALANRIN